MLDLRHWLAAALLLAAAPAFAEERGGEAGADTSPTAWSCTVETLHSGDECVFETEAKPAADPGRQAIENARRAAALAEQACARAARRSVEPVPDPSVLAACKKEFAEKAMACGSDGSYPLLDSAGRFSPGMRVCYFAMADVLARAKFMAEATARCCRCLVVNGCAKSGEQCNRQAASGEIRAEKCLGGCGEVCASFIPDSGPPQPPSPPRAEADAPKKRTAKDSNIMILVPAPPR